MSSPLPAPSQVQSIPPPASIERIAASSKGLVRNALARGRGDVRRNGFWVRLRSGQLLPEGLVASGSSRPPCPRGSSPDPGSWGNTVTGTWPLDAAMRGFQ